MGYDWCSIDPVVRATESDGTLHMLHINIHIDQKELPIKEPSGLRIVHSPELRVEFLTIGPEPIFPIRVETMPLPGMSPKTLSVMFMPSKSLDDAEFRLSVTETKTKDTRYVMSNTTNTMLMLVFPLIGEG